MAKAIGIILDLLLALCSLIKIIAGGATSTDHIAFWGLLLFAIVDVVRRTSE